MRVLREHRLLTALLVAALAARLAWVLTRGQVDARLPDQAEYLALARSLLDGRGLVFTDPRFADDVFAYRMPGYPLFLAACGASPLAARLAQAVIDAANVLGVYLLARRVLPRGPALVSAAAAAFNPFLVYFTGMLLTETLFTALLVWGMVLLAYRRNYLWGGLVLALSIHLRPGAVALPVVLGVGAVLFLRTHDEPRDEPAGRSYRWARLPVGTTMLLLTALVLLPWLVRNRLTLGHWVLLTTNGGITRYDGFNPDATGASDQRFLQWPSVRARYASRPHPPVGPAAAAVAIQGDTVPGEVRRDAVFSDLASRWTAETARQRPMRLVELTLAKVGRTWTPVPLSAEFGSSPAYRWGAMAFSIPFYLLVVTGLATGAASGGLPARIKAFLLLPALYLTVIHALTVGSLRYRVPAEGPLAVLAGAGLAAAVSVFARPTWKWRRPTGPVSDIVQSAAPQRP